MIEIKIRLIADGSLPENPTYQDIEKVADGILSLLKIQNHYCPVKVD